MSDSSLTNIYENLIKSGYITEMPDIKEVRDSINTLTAIHNIVNEILHQKQSDDNIKIRLKNLEIFTDEQIEQIIRNKIKYMKPFDIVYKNRDISLKKNKTVILQSGGYEHKSFKKTKVSKVIKNLVRQSRNKKKYILGGYPTSDKIKEKTTALKEKATTLKEKASAKVDDIKEKATEKVEQMKETATKNVDEMKEKATTLKEKANEKLDEMKETATEKVDEMKEKATTLKEKATEKVDEMKEKATEKVDEMKEKATEKLDEMKEKATEKVDEMKETATEKVDEMKEKATTLKEKANEKVDEMKEKATELKEKTNERIDEILEKSKDGIEDDLDNITSDSEQNFSIKFNTNEISLNINNNKFLNKIKNFDFNIFLNEDISIIDWVFFPLWSIENTPYLGVPFGLYLDFLSIVIAQTDIFYKMFATFLNTIKGPSLQMFMTIFTLGPLVTVGAFITPILSPVLAKIMDMYIHMISNTANITNLFIQISRKNFGLAYIILCEILPLFEKIMNKLINLMIVINKLLTRGNQVLDMYIYFLDNYAQTFLKMTSLNFSDITNKMNFFKQKADKIKEMSKKELKQLNDRNEARIKELQNSLNNQS